MGQVNITQLIDDAQCYQTSRELRWPDGLACTSCQSTQVINAALMTRNRHANAMSVLPAPHALLI